MPTLYSWTTDLDGNEQVRDATELDVDVEDFNEATGKLVEDLYHHASDNFLTTALGQWFTQGKISDVDQGNGLYWHVELR